MNTFWTENNSALTRWTALIILLLLVVPPLVLWAVLRLVRKRG